MAAPKKHQDFDIDALSPAQLKALIDKAQAKQREGLEDRALRMKAKLQAICEAEGLTLSQVFFAGRTNRAEPKYRDPKTGKTWSGRGGKPKWLVGHESEYALG